MSLRERMAELAHLQWAMWASTIMTSEKISHERRQRWERLIATPYAELSESEKNQDRVWADRYLALIDEA